MSGESLVQQGRKSVRQKPDKSNVLICRNCGFVEKTFLGKLKTKFCPACGDLMFPKGTNDVQRWNR